MVFKKGDDKMAPKQKITKEMILEAAFKITRDSGFENVNARSIASVIGCSTQPIFSRYENMNDLKNELHVYAGNYFNEYALGKMQGENAFQNLGIAYVNFAKNDSNLFRLLFMSELMGLNDFSDMYSDADNVEVAIGLSKNLGISLEDAQKLYMKVWIFNHGIASMVATKSIKLRDGEAEKMMSDAYLAFYSQVKEI